MDLVQPRCRLVAHDSAASQGSRHCVEEQPRREHVAGVPVASADTGSHLLRELLQRGEDRREVSERRRRLIVTTRRIGVLPRRGEDLRQATYAAVERLRGLRRERSGGEDVLGWWQPVCS